MKTVLVTYYSRSGNTKKMAELITKGLVARGIKADLIPVEEVPIDSLPGYDGFIVGSPNYFGTMAWPIKKFVDESVKYYKKLEGKAAAAFTSEGIIGGGGGCGAAGYPQMFPDPRLCGAGAHRHRAFRAGRHRGAGRADWEGSGHSCGAVRCAAGEAVSGWRNVPIGWMSGSHACA